MATSQAETDEDLARRCAQGDKHAFRVLYERHLGRVTHQVGRLMGPSADVEAVVQDVFVQVYRSLKGFRGESRFTTWLYRVTRNVTVDRLRRQPPTVALPELRGLMAPQQEWGRLTAREQLKHLYAALNNLSASHREAFILYEMEGKTLAEISELTGDSLNTVASRVRRSRENLRTLLAQLDQAQQRPSRQEGQA
jgi:RNA polymerase sigma-70 factor (ECF subfamily)